MKTRLKLARLKTVLPQETVEALESGGFFDSSDEVIVNRKAVSSATPELEEGERACIGYISTRDIDRDKEVMDPAGCVTAEFLLAPQILWAHDYSLPPTGKAEWLKVDEHGILAKMVYAETERAEEVWSLKKGGFLSTTSVGFIALQRFYKGGDGWDACVKRYNKKWATDLEVAGCQTITTKWLLLEFSDVPVPCNPYALTTAVAKGMHLSKGMLEQLGIEEDEPAEESVPAPVLIEVVGKEEAAKSETKRLIETVSAPIPVSNPRFVEIVKQVDSVDRRSLAIVNETLAEMRGRV